MNEPTTCCTDEQLRALLASDDDGDSPISAHASDCPRCQRRLEQLAAEPTEWRTAQESLSAPLERQRTSATLWERDHAARRGQRNMQAWMESMVQQLLSPPSHPEMLGRIGRYEVERLIGSGGMGVVFKAFDTELNRPVAVKVLAPYLAGSGAARQRFAREARAAAAVVNEHVVAIHNVESEGASPFLVMPFIAGESLQQRMDRQGPLELCEILRIATQTASGLAAAHAQGLVHRDVKPSNILLEQGVERALLTDFGLARASDDASLTHTGFHPGTPQYMSPEQARGESVGPRSDLFSLGSVIYAMGTGRPPFRAETNYGVLRRITDDEPRCMREVNPAIPEWLEAIVMRLLDKDPESRFPSAERLAELLEQCLAHAQHPTRVALPAECRPIVATYHYRALLGHLPRPLRGRPIALLAVLSAAIAVAGAIGLRNSPSWSPFNNPAAPGITNNSASNDRDPATGWDVVERQIDQFDGELGALEEQVRQPWGAREAEPWE